MDTPNRMDAPPTPRSRPVGSLDELAAALDSLETWVRAFPLTIDGLTEGDPFVVDGLAPDGSLRSPDLEAYVRRAEIEASIAGTFEDAVRWALVHLRADPPDLERAERALVEARTTVADLEALEV